MISRKKWAPEKILSSPTVWKFHFCIIQILREINFEDSWGAKSAILTHSEALEFFMNSALFQDLNLPN